MKVEGPISHIHDFNLSISATASLNLAVTVEPLPGIDSSTSTAPTRLIAALQPVAVTSENVEGNRNLEAGKVQLVAAAKFGQIIFCSKQVSLCKKKGLVKCFW